MFEFLVIVIERGTLIPTTPTHNKAAHAAEERSQIWPYWEGPMGPIQNHTYMYVQRIGASFGGKIFIHSRLTGNVINNVVFSEVIIKRFGSSPLR